MNAMVSMSPGGVGISERPHLALMGRDGATETGGPFLVDASADLLRTIAEVLDIRRVFPRVSEIVKHVLPHDALELMFHDRGGHVTLEAGATGDLAGRSGSTGSDEEDFSIVSALRRPRSRLAGGEPAFVEALLAAGY